MRKGFIVAKLKFKDRDVFHCVDGSGHNWFLMKDEMIRELTQGNYVNGFVCGTGERAYVRLAGDIPTLEQDKKYSVAEFRSFVPVYLNNSATVNQMKRSRKIADNYR